MAPHQRSSSSSSTIGISSVATRTTRPSQARSRRRGSHIAATAAAASAPLLLLLLAAAPLRPAAAGAVSTALEAILRLPPVPFVTAAGIAGIDAGTQPNGIGPTWSRGINEVVVPPAGSPAAVVRAKTWLNATSPSFLYPEQDPAGDHFLPALLEKPNFGVCMSGGGLRAAILMLGYGRVLWREGLLQKARYAASSSGSSWFLAAFSYANATGTPWNSAAVAAAAAAKHKGGVSDADDNDNNNNNGTPSTPSSTFDGEAFFGRYLPPERLSEEAARRELGAWGRAVADAQLTPHSLWGGIAYRRRALTWWSDVASDLFLRPFGLHDLASGTSAWGTKGPVAARVAAALARASNAQRVAEARKAAETLQGNLAAVESVRQGVLKKTAGSQAAAGAAASAAAAALKTNATRDEALWRAAEAKLGVRRVWPANPAGSPPPVYQACTQDRPYPLLAGTIYAPQDPTLFYPFEMTPMYVGAPGAYPNASSPVGALGGGLVESHAWNSRLADGGRRAFADARRAVAESEAAAAAGSAAAAAGSAAKLDVDASVDYFVPLAGQVGVSSAFLAQGFRPSSSPLKQLFAVDHFLYWNQLDFGPAKNVLFADGGGADPLGIYGNLRRGVKALLVLHATFQEPTGAAEEFALAGGYEVASLFGYVPRGSTRYSGTDEKHTAAQSQVFEAKEWPNLYRELRARFYAGEPPVIRRRGLKVLPNAFQAVRGGYEADVVFVFNAKTAGWEERLPVATRLGLEKGRGSFNSPLGSYPVVPTGLAHAGPGLTGLLGQQASWTMIHALPVIKALLADLPEGERGVGRFETTREEAERAPAEAAAMAVGLAVGEAPWADVDRADAGLGALGEKVIDAVVAHVPRGPAPGLVSTAAGKLARLLGGKSGVDEDEAAAAAAVAVAVEAAAADAASDAGAGAGANGVARATTTTTTTSTSRSPPPRGPGAAAVVGNAAVMAALAAAPAESGVGGALAALAAAASPMLVDGRPPTRAQSRAAALAANDPRPAHERWLTRQYTRAQALGSAVGGLRTQAVADTAGKLVSGVEDKLTAPAVKAVRRATDLLAPVKGPLMRRAAGALAAGDLQGANE